MLPKVLYLVLQGVFLVALVGLNWDYLVTDGITALVLTSLLTVGTLVFYFLTGCTDPGYVRNQIFDNHYETTEFIEDDETVTDKRGGDQRLHQQLKS